MLTTDELSDAEIKICKLVQQEAYANEIESLLNNKVLSKDSATYGLMPYIETAIYILRVE